MLNSMRKGINSWFIKILLALLIISFGLWGIGDIFVSGGNKAILAKIGKNEIGQTEFLKEYSINLQNLSQQLGKKILPTEANNYGLVNQTLGTMINDLVYKEITDEYGMHINNSTVKKEIYSIPGFLDSTGSFNKFAFERYLNITGQSEEEVINKIKNDIAKRQIFLSVSSGFSAPKNIINKLYNYREEKRKISFIELENNNYAIKKFNDTDLINHYEKNKNSYQSSELRGFTFINISPEEVSKEIKISKDSLFEKYNQNKNEYFEPEERSIIQIISNNEKDILKAKDLINSKNIKNFANIENLNLPNINYGELNNIKWNELPREIAEFIFNLKNDEWSQPYKTSLGWHLIYIKQIKAEGITPLKKIEKKLIKEIQLDKAYDIIYQISNNLEDQLASEKTLSEAGNRIGLSVIDIPLIENDITNLSNLKMTNSLKEKILNKVFSINDKNNIQSFETDEGGLIYFKINNIKLSQTKSYEESKEQVLKELEFKKKNVLLNLDGKNKFDKVKNGLTLQELSKNSNTQLNTSNYFKRSDVNKEYYLSSEMMNKVFLTQKGRYMYFFNADSGKFFIIKVIDVKSPNKNEVNNEYTRVKQSIDSSFSNDLIISLNKSLRKKLNIEIYENNIQKINYSGLIN